MEGNASRQEQVGAGFAGAGFLGFLFTLLIRVLDYYGRVADAVEIATLISYRDVRIYLAPAIAFVSFLAFLVGSAIASPWLFRSMASRRSRRQHAAQLHSLVRHFSDEDLRRFERLCKAGSTELLHLSQAEALKQLPGVGYSSIRDGVGIIRILDWRLRATFRRTLRLVLRERQREERRRLVEAIRGLTRNQVQVLRFFTTRKLPDTDPLTREPLISAAQSLHRHLLYIHYNLTAPEEKSKFKGWDVPTRGSLSIVRQIRGGLWLALAWKLRAPLLRRRLDFQRRD